MASSAAQLPLPSGPWTPGIVAGAGCITEQILLDIQSGLATRDTYYLARFHFPHTILNNQDVHPTFARPENPPNIVLKFTPHEVYTTWFPAWIINGYLVYCLPAETPAVGTCGDTPSGPPVADVPGGGMDDIPPGGPGRPIHPIPPGRGLLSRIMLNSSPAELKALAAAIDSARSPA